MKYRTIILAVALGAPASTLAQSAESLVICSASGNVAQVVMENRQNGIPMSVQVEKILPPTEPARSLVMAIIVAAYDVSRYSSPDNVRRAVEDFRNDTEAKCFRGMNKGN